MSEWQPAIYVNAHPSDDKPDDAWESGAHIWIKPMNRVHPITLQFFREVGCTSDKFYRVSIDGTSESDGAVCSHEILTD